MSFLPAELTPFVGRRQLHSDLCALLRGESRLTTLIGPGGVGKTRLALRAAAADDVAAAHPDGVRLLDLTKLDTPNLLHAAVAEVLGLQSTAATPPLEQVQNFLRTKQLLLVLDNCEHLAEAVADLCTELLKSAPDLRILATSRHVLDVPGEQITTVPPLDVPPESTTLPAASDVDAERLLKETERSDAVVLFIDRARDAQPQFSLTTDNRASVSKLVITLDGVPLAMELAARRLRTMALEDITHGIRDRFRLLKTSHRTALQQNHSSLAAVLDWSWDLLSPREQRFWARLSVLNRMRTADVAAICADQPGDVCPDEQAIDADNVADLLADLVDKSIVLADTTVSPAVYRMLESQRQYGLQRLKEDFGEDEYAVVRHRHATYWREWTGRAAEEHRGPDETGWLASLHLNFPNIREALEWSARNDPACGLDIILATVRTAIWEHRGALPEATYWLWHLRAASDHAAPDGRMTGRRDADSLAWMAWVHCMQGDPGCDDLLAQAKAALPAGETSPDVLHAAGAVAYMVHDSPTSLDLLDQAAAGFQAEGRRSDFLIADLIRTIATVFVGSRSAAETAVRRCLTHASAAHGPRTIAWAQWPAAAAELWWGDLDTAEALSKSALSLQRRDAVDDRWWGGTWTLRLRAWILAARGQMVRAAVTHGCAEQREADTGVAVQRIKGVAKVHEEALNRVVDALGQRRFDELAADGRRLGWEAAVSYALGELPEDPTLAAAEAVGGGAHDPAGLTDREHQVARLIANGLTYQAIATELVISVKTVEVHARNVRRKLLDVSEDPSAQGKRLTLLALEWLERLRRVVP